MARTIRRDQRCTHQDVGEAAVLSDDRDGVLDGAGTERDLVQLHVAGLDVHYTWEEQTLKLTSARRKLVVGMDHTSIYISLNSARCNVIGKSILLQINTVCLLDVIRT